MSEYGFNTKSVRFAAQETQFTTDEVAEILETVEDEMEDKLAVLFDEAWRKSGQNVVARIDNDSFVFGFTEGEWITKLEETDLTSDEIRAAMMAHQHLARNVLGFAVSSPSNYPDHFPMLIRKPEHWKDAEDATGSRFRMMFQFGLTPTEILDFWLCEYCNWDRDKVAAWRGVDRPAVNKSIRNASEKLDDYDNADGFYRERNIEGEHLDFDDDEARFDGPDLKSLKSIDAEE